VNIGKYEVALKKYEHCQFKDSLAEVKWKNDPVAQAKWLKDSTEYEPCRIWIAQEKERRAKIYANMVRLQREKDSLQKVALIRNIDAKRLSTDMSYTELCLLYSRLLHENDSLQKVAFSKKIDAQIASKTMSKTELANLYFIEDNRFGWSNCDRFRNYPNLITMNTSANKETEVKYILKSDKVITPKTQALPYGEDVYILATKIEDGKIYSSVTLTKVDTELKTLDFQRVNSLADLRAQWASIK